MYAKYIKQEIADLNGMGRTQAYYKMKLRPMNYRWFVSQCAREGRMDESTILGVLSLVSEKLALCIAEGFSVKLEGIGTFSAKLGVRDDMLQDAFEPGESERNASTIQVTGVAYRADSDLISNTSEKCYLKKGGVSRLHKSKYTLEQRIQLACDYLKTHAYMRVPDYAELTGLSRSTATLELRKLARNRTAGIVSNGERSHKIYVLAPTPSVQR